MASRVRLIGQWRELEAALNPTDFKRRLDRELVRSFGRIGMKFVALARREITREQYRPNSPITVILKGSSKALVDRGQLFQAITHQVGLDGRSLRLGIVKRRTTPEVVDLALVLHQGAVIDVGRHPQVRRKVWAMVGEALRASGLLSASRRGAVQRAAVSLGGGSGRSDLWIIPGRPFLEQPLASPEFQAYARSELAAAAKRALVGGR